MKRVPSVLVEVSFNKKIFFKDVFELIVGIKFKRGSEESEKMIFA